MNIGLDKAAFLIELAIEIASCQEEKCLNRKELKKLEILSDRILEGYTSIDKVCQINRENL